MFIEPMAAEIAKSARRFEPDLILAIGGFHVPLDVLEALRDLRLTAPITGWVGDSFETEAKPLAALYDLAAYTDSGFEDRHRTLDFPHTATWLPHAANPHRETYTSAKRARRMVFVGAASPERETVISDLTQAITIKGPGWSTAGLAMHDFSRRRVAHRELAAIYAGHSASLNIRNAHHVVSGLNQRSFDPYLFGAAVVSDDQPDLQRCFDVDKEVLVYRTPEGLNEAHARIQDPLEAARIAAAGRKRILGQHTFAHRLTRLTQVLGLAA